MKALYAFFQSNNSEVIAGEAELNKSIDKVYEIYLYYLSFIVSLKDFIEAFIEERKLKHLPTEEDLNPKLNLIKNKVIQALGFSPELKKQLDKYKISWNGSDDLLRKVYFEFRNDGEYRAYLHIEEPDIEEDKKIIQYLFDEYIFKSEAIRQLFEDKSIYWLDDIELMELGVQKTIGKYKANSALILLPILKKPEEEMKFALDLFRKTILHSQAYESEIARKAQNWESERVAKMDMILMKMAICELTEFSEIPIKVTLDEYIELAKGYSSPQSKNFINGILDKIVVEYKRDDRIRKTGLGLLES